LAFVYIFVECTLPWSYSGLFSASAVNVREAHEYMRAIQPCNCNTITQLFNSLYFSQLTITQAVSPKLSWTFTMNMTAQLWML